MVLGWLPQAVEAAPFPLYDLVLVTRRVVNFEVTGRTEEGHYLFAPLTALRNVVVLTC